MDELSFVEIFLIEPEVDDPDYTDILIRVEHVEYYDKNGENIKNFDDSKWDGFFYWDFQTVEEMIESIADCLGVDSKIVEIAD